MAIYYVYMHRNRVNGKVYIGETSNPDITWANNGARYKDNDRFVSDIRKYGWDNFDHLITECNTQWKADITKDVLVRLYDSTNPEKGYNKPLYSEPPFWKQYVTVRQNPRIIDPELLFD